MIGQIERTRKNRADLAEPAGCARGQSQHEQGWQPNFYFDKPHSILPGDDRVNESNSAWRHYGVIVASASGMEISVLITVSASARQASAFSSKLTSNPV